MINIANNFVKGSEKDSVVFVIVNVRKSTIGCMVSISYSVTFIISIIFILDVPPQPALKIHIKEDKG